MTDVKVCPECDQPTIYFRSGKQGGPKGYRCYGCSATFDDPHYRRSRAQDNCLRKDSLARKLLEMDPAEVTGD